MYVLPLFRLSRTSCVIDHQTATLLFWAIGGTCRFYSLLLRTLFFRLRGKWADARYPRERSGADRSRHSQQFMRIMRLIKCVRTIRALAVHPLALKYGHHHNTKQNAFSFVLRLVDFTIGRFACKLRLIDRHGRWPAVHHHHQHQHL